jgi:hypothetical protein
MKTTALSFLCSPLAAAVLLAAQVDGAQTRLAASRNPNRYESVSLDDLDAQFGQQSQDNGLSLTAMPEGARLLCGVQKLQGHATAEGLWLESTKPGAEGKFRLTAIAVGREVLKCGRPLPLSVETGSHQSGPDGSRPQSKTLSRNGWHLPVMDQGVLDPNGTVLVEGDLVRFTRRGLIEEYSVSMNGVQQDFVIVDRPAGTGELRVELALSGAQAEAADYGAKLALEGSGRVLAYSRLRVLDATGKELAARLEVLGATRLAVRLDDADARYPVCVDPTFSDANWVSLSPGMPGANAEVLAVAVDDSGRVYVGGAFTVIGTVVANHIAVWDGSAWSALGGGTDGIVYALAANGTNLYVGGRFTTAGAVPANCIAKWDGSSWSPLGSGIMKDQYPLVAALVISGTSLYAGGSFTNAGGVTVSNIARWDGSSWSALGSGMDSLVSSLAVSETNLYAGGYFLTAGGVSAKRVAKWDGSTWAALGPGMNADVYALAVSGSSLYVGGIFTPAGAMPGKYIAKWNGSIWSAVGSGVSSDVYGLAVSGTNLYAGGNFYMAGGKITRYIARWDGSAWTALGSGLSSYVNALVVSGTNLYVGGNFGSAGDLTAGTAVAAKGIVNWNGSSWSALGSGVDNSIFALGMSGTNLYVGGRFITVGGVVANHIAKWDGTVWSALGSGVSGDVTAVAVSGTDLYAGGFFTTAGGVPANHIAKWDGSVWSAIGSGVDNHVYSLAVIGSNLYAGGTFTMSGIPMFIAKWDGSAWSTVDSGMTSDVNAMAVIGGDLYVAATSVGKWDGNVWSSLSRMSNDYPNSPDVYALAVSGSSLYAGGTFTIAGGVSATNIAKWDGSAWSALGAGINGQVSALAASGTDLYAAGRFTTAGGVPALNIAKWDGSAWSALGTGVSAGTSPAVNALAVDGLGHLFVGGSFSMAGSIVAPFVAQADIAATPGKLSGLSCSPLTGFSFIFSNAAVGYAYRVQNCTSIAGDGWTDLTNFTYNGPTTITDSSAAASNRFYRAVSP